MAVQITSESEEYQPPEVGVPGPMQRDLPVSVQTPEQIPGSKLLETFNALNEEMKANRVQSQTAVTNASLIADPQIRAYLEARQRGQAVKLVADVPVEDKPADLPPPPKNLEDMTNAEMIQYVTQSAQVSIRNEFQAELKKAMSSFRDEVAPQLNGLLSSEEQRQANEISSQISKVAEKYEDFDAMKPLIKKINSEVKGLSVEELYVLAKVRSGQSITPPPVQSEKPGQAPSQRSGTPRQVLPNKPGRSGFAELLTAALNR